MIIFHQLSALRFMLYARKELFMKKQIQIIGMHCTSCAANIENSLLKVPGVIDVEVNYTTEKASIDVTNDFTNDSDLIKTIVNHGYKAAIIKDESPSMA